MSSTRSAKAERLRHDYKAHVRAIQISEKRVFAYCEGRVFDPYIYAELLNRAKITDENRFELYRIEEITGTGGKEAALKLFRYLRQRNILDGLYKGKPYYCVFLLDKDVDDITRRKMKSDHLFYTELYDLEAHIYRDCSLAKAVAIALSIGSDLVPHVYRESAAWIESKAARWHHWIMLCLFSSIYSLDCGCGYGRISSINAGLIGPTDCVAFHRFRRQLQGKMGLSQPDFDRQFARVENITNRLKAGGRLSLAIKGKWLESILNQELQLSFEGKAYSTGSLGVRLSTAAMASFDFGSAWGSQLIAIVSRLFDKVYF